MGLMDALQDPLFWRDVRRNAKDLGQSASNAALSNVTGPVDMANSLLGLLGIKSAEPVGGAKWAERVGLSKPVGTGLPQVVGETLGLVAPFAGARAPQVANKLLEYTDNVMAPSAANQAARNQLGAIVYHGSPHKFDRFDASKIGTGEGAQAYGHGLYFAESPEVAGSYQSALSYKNNASLVKNGPNSYDVIAPDGTKIVEGVWLGKASKAKDAFDASQKGALYKVDLPDNAIARMLDWDKPLSQQTPEVQAALKAAGVADIDNWAQTGLRGSEAYKRAKMGAPAKLPLRQIDDEIFAAQKLRAAGIPGIRYLDAGSRGAGAGTSNYVVFPGEESLLKILERNGMAP